MDIKKIALVLILAFVSFVSFSQTSTWSGGISTFTHGNGTQSNPYLIENANQLAYLAQAVNAGTGNYASAYYRMTVNINLNNIGWTPIGTENFAFTGNFDGDGHTIANVTIETSYFGNGSVFGSIGGVGVIRNTGRIGSSNGVSGGIVNMFSGTMIDCYNKSNISANSNAGGLASISTGIIKRCYNTGNITSLNGCAGGIVGYSGGTAWSTAALIDHCYNSGNINGGIASGGIIGQTKYSAPDDCGWAVWNPCCKLFDISNCYNKGQINGGYGAIMGSLIEDISSSVTNCYFLNTCGGTYANGGAMRTSTVMTSSAFLEIMNTNNTIGIFEKDTTPYQNNGYPIISNRIKIINISNLTPYSVFLDGSYTDDYAYYPYCGFRYKAANQSDYLYIDLENQDSITLTGLQYNTNYKVQYFVNRIFDTLYSKTYYFQTANLPIITTTTEICQGETYSFMDSSYSTTGVYTIVENDTIHKLNLTVYPLYNDTLNINVCNGESYTFNDTVYSSSCYHTSYFQSIHGCDSIITLHLTVLPEYRPIITITNDTSICRGDSITLTANGASSFLWNNNSTTQSISVSPTTTKLYIVTASNSIDCFVKDTVIVTVKPLPLPSISGISTFCEGNNSTLTANGGVQYLWSTGDTTNSIIVDTAGIYSVLATGLNGCSKSVQKNIIVSSIPNLTVNTNDTSICKDDTITLNAIANNVTRYEWSSGQQTSSINVSPNATQSYIVTAYNSYNCSKTDTINVVVNPLPTLSFTGDTSICNGHSTNISINGAESYLWSNDSTDSSLTLSPSSSTQYSVIGTNSYLCSSSLTIPITVHQPIHNIDSIQACDSYTWIDGITYTENTNTPSYTLTSIHGCDSIINLNLTIINTPIITTTNDTAICMGESITLTANGASSYLWTNNNYHSTAQSISVSPLSTTKYIINGYNSPNCFVKDTIIVTVNPLPNVGIIGNMDIYEGQSIELRATGANSYSWSNGSSGEVISVSPTQTTQYSVIGKDANNCSDTAKIKINVQPTIGLSDVEISKLISIYPNPTSDKISISYKSNKLVIQKIILLNILGKKILEQPINNENDISLDLSSYSSGLIYMEILFNNGEKLVKKIIKK